MSRAELRALFISLANRTHFMPPRAVDRLIDHLRAFDWDQHVTDDIYTMACCGVDGTHAPDCPVGKLLAETAVTR